MKTQEQKNNSEIDKKFTKIIDEILEQETNQYKKQEQKQHLIDLMNMKTIEEAAEEELNFIHNSVRCIDFDLGFKNGAIIGANYQKQIDENLALEFGNFLLKEIWTNKLAGKKLDECFQIFQSERNK